MVSRNAHREERGTFMPSLFERPYRAAATTELERSMRAIEDRNKKAQTRGSFDEQVAAMLSNLQFAQKLNLISEQQAAAYKERVEESQKEYARIQRAEREENRARNPENPAGNSEKLMSMEEVQAQISRERANDSAQHSQSQPTQSTPSHAKDEDDGARTH